MADGWISENGHFVICCKNKDQSHLQKIATLLKTNIGKMQNMDKNLAAYY